MEQKELQNYESCTFLKQVTRCAALILLTGVAMAVIQPAKLLAQDDGQDVKSDSKVTPTTPAPSLAVAPLDGYQIEPGDKLDIYVYDVPELSHTYSVSQSGTITVPLLAEPLIAAGLTPEQLAHSMEDAFRQSGRLRRPEIAVSVPESRNSVVTIDGAVKQPQLLPMVWEGKLIDVLTRCGGPTEDAGNKVTITRGPLALRNLPAQGQEPSPVLTAELSKVMDSTNPASNIIVWPGDRISINRSGVFYIMGQVARPGGYSLKNGGEELTVLRALAISGDVTGVAKKSKAFIIRKDPKAPNGRVEVALNLKKILDGKSPDPLMQANDILFVPGSRGKKALHAFTSLPTMVAGTAITATVLH